MIEQLVQKRNKAWDERDLLRQRVDELEEYNVNLHEEFHALTTGRWSISDKMMWRNLSLPLMPILFVTKLVLITIMLVISDNILIHHRKHL
jgi:hypothetical protein